MRRLFHALFALAVLIGPWGEVREALSIDAARVHGSDEGMPASCCCGTAGIQGPADGPCSPGHGSNCPVGIGKVAIRTAVILVQDECAKPDPKNIREPRPWPAALAGFQDLLEFHSRVALKVHQDPRLEIAHAAERLDRLTNLRI